MVNCNKHDEEMTGCPSIPRVGDCLEAHEDSGVMLVGIMAARSDTQCSLVLVHRMGSPCSFDEVDAGGSYSCSHSDGTCSSWIFAVGEGVREA